MFTPTHAALGALVQHSFARKRAGMLATALTGVVLHAIMDNPQLWHAPYPWPPDTPAILHILPYPHDVLSSLWLGLILALTVLTLFILRRFWWGVLWANAPDIVDWVILRPILGISWVHDYAFPYLYTMWGAPLELTALLVILFMLGACRCFAVVAKEP